MAKLKLKPSQKIKRRYLLIESSDRDNIEKVILDYIGILGWARASPYFVKSSGNEIILGVTRESLNEVRAAFEISKEKIKILRVSGTLKGLGQ
jgi:RNase P/RNase MRP subunit POP5